MNPGQPLHWRAQWLKWNWAWLICLVLGHPHLGTAAEWTIGQKSLLFIRIDFGDIPGDPVTLTNAAAVMRTVGDYYRAVSDGKLSVETTFTPTIRMPQPATWYAQHHTERDEDARAAAKALGFDPAKFDLEIMVFNRTVGGDGVGIFRGKGVFLAPPISFSGVVHELGHNFGLPHNAVWKTWDGSVIGAGTSMTYADPDDPMGGGGDDPRKHFSIRSKVLLKWWGPGDFVNVEQSGTYQIYAQDMPGAAGPRGLRIRRDATNDYWVEFRQLVTDNPYLMNGVRILKCAADGSGRVDMTLNLLDMTPGSSLGATDAALLLGRTFSDDEAGIYVTPVAKRGTTPESLDLMVNLGHHTNSHPPKLRLTASRRTPGVGEPAVLQAMTGDAEGNPLQYSWDFGDGSFAWGQSVVTNRWQTADRDFVVRCSSTDTQGGSANKLLLVTVGQPSRHRVVGTLTSGGEPLANALVVADSTHTTYTDSDGLFALTDLESGRHRISAHAAGFWISSVSADCPGTETVALTAVPLKRDTVWSEKGFELQEGDVLQTLGHFRPPVEIVIVAKTSATNLRIGYAADQVIFNWEVNGSELRVDGGPASGRHAPGMGAIPANQYVTIRWVVTPKSQSIFVNDKLRFQHAGDYSQLDRPVSVFTHESTVTVRSIKVTELPAGRQ